MMRKLSILLLSIFVFTSCCNDDDNDEHTVTDIDLPGEWELVRTIAPFDGSARTGAEMEWQESYILRADGSFTKRRVRDNETTVAEGTYVLNEEPFTPGEHELLHISMIYESANGIIATCYSDRLREELFFPTEEVMKSTYEQCDGLGLEYMKKGN